MRYELWFFLVHPLGPSTEKRCEIDFSYFFSIEWVHLRKALQKVDHVVQIDFADNSRTNNTNIHRFCSLLSITDLPRCRRLHWTQDRPRRTVRPQRRRPQWDSRSFPARRFPLFLHSGTGRRNGRGWPWIPASLPYARKGVCRILQHREECLHRPDEDPCGYRRGW